jgi:catechol 2,3-dioxygenase
MIEVKRDDQNRAYFKGWTEIDAFSVVLREADEPGMDFMGWKVTDSDTLASLKQDLIDYGCNVETIPAGELEGCGERVRFDSPTGHYFELKGMRATRFDHCLLYGDDIDGTAELLQNVLGFQLAEQVVDKENDLRVAAFLTVSMKAHDVAFVRHPENGKFHHASFYLESWNDVLRAADLISMHDIPLDIGPTRHGLTHGQTIYFFDPPVVTWDADKLGKAIFYHDRRLNEAFLGVVT